MVTFSSHTSYIHTYRRWSFHSPISELIQRGQLPGWINMVWIGYIGCTGWVELFILWCISATRAIHTIQYIQHASIQYVIHNTCSLRLAELTEMAYFYTNARIVFITINSHCIEQNGEHNGCIYSKTVSLKSHTQAESVSSIICASVLLSFAGYTSRSSHTPSSLLPVAPLVHPDKSGHRPSLWSGQSIQHHVEVGLSCRETHTLPVLRDLAGQAAQVNVCCRILIFSSI